MNDDIWLSSIIIIIEQQFVETIPFVFQSGRGPGRPPKRLHLENKNFTLSSPGPGATSESPAHGTIPSYPPSPTSTEVVWKYSAVSKLYTTIT